MNLNEFLVKAKLATYAKEGEKNERILKDGCKELSFKDKNFEYRDRYYGFDPFVGEELVWKNNKLVWSMNYYGKITSDLVPAKKIYRFLRSAMKNVKKNRPFRGPDYFKENDFEYFDESFGDINDFSGIEKIRFRGREIYALKYHGGHL